MPQMDWIESPAELRTLRTEWTDLLRDSASDVPFLTWEWLEAWCTHLRGPASLKVVAVRSRGTLVAIAPFTLNPHAMPWFSRLEFLGTGAAGSDYLDLIVRTGHHHQVLPALAALLTKERMTVRLDRLRTNALAVQLAERLGSQGWVTSTTEDGVCPVIPLAGLTWDSYLATLGSAHRANVRRRVREALQQFQARFEPVTCDADRRSALTALASFHERRFHKKGGSTAFLTPALKAFHDHATRSALERGWLRMYVLRFGDDVAAVMYGFLYDRRFYFYQHGFDERYARNSVGLVLMALTIRAAIDERAEAFDLLWGAEAYKSRWTHDALALRRIDLFPAHAAGRIHRRAIEARRSIGRIARLVTASGDQGATRP